MPAPASPGKALADKITTINKSIAAGAPGPTASPIHTSWVGETQADGHLNGQAERATIVTQLQQVEASLAALPDTAVTQDLRAPLVAKHAELKGKLSATKPLGVRLDGCRAALARARSRLVTAEETVRAAHQARDEAAEQVQQFEAELRDLETVIQPQQSESNSNSIGRLQSGLEQVVNEMAASPHTSQQEVQSVMAQMTGLFRQVSEISARCLQQGLAQGHLQAQSAAAPPAVAPTASPTSIQPQTLTDADMGDERCEQQRLQALFHANAVSAQASAGGA